MKIFFPKWVTHAGSQIYSIDIHPNGNRFATGGGDNRAKIWSLPLLREQAITGTTASPPNTLLAELRHYAPVNCVRWSHSGTFLATGQDKGVIMIWVQRDTSSTVPAFGETQEIETWTPDITLRGHTSDVIDLCWSPDSKRIASASVDNTVIIWDVANKLKLKVLAKHSGMVKGVSWDPLGQYLATQGDDNQVIIWKIATWDIVTVIKTPFKKGDSAFFRRLSWSPDGLFVATVHGFNGPSHVAPVIQRDEWSVFCDFVGHKKPVVCARYNPVLFRTREGEGTFTCCAVGSQDCAISLWSAAKERPVMVCKDVFDHSILDIAWGMDGLTMMCCSLGGKTAIFLLTEDEVGGTPLSEEDRRKVLQETHGRLNESSTSLLDLAESTVQLTLEKRANRINARDTSMEEEGEYMEEEDIDEENHHSHPFSTHTVEGLGLGEIKEDHQSHSPLTLPHTNDNTDIVVSSSSSSVVSTGGNGAKATPTQKESVLSDGRRRITPLFLGGGGTSFSSSPAPAHPPLHVEVKGKEKMEEEVLKKDGDEEELVALRDIMNEEENAAGNLKAPSQPSQTSQHTQKNNYTLKKTKEKKKGKKEKTKEKSSLNSRKRKGGRVVDEEGYSSPSSCGSEEDGHGGSRSKRVRAVVHAGSSGITLAEPRVTSRIIQHTLPITHSPRPSSSNRKGEFSGRRRRSNITMGTLMGHGGRSSTPSTPQRTPTQHDQRTPRRGVSHGIPAYLDIQIDEGDDDDDDDDNDDDDDGNEEENQVDGEGGVSGRRRRRVMRKKKKMENACTHSFVKKRMGGQVMWEDIVYGRVSRAAGNEYFSVVGTVDGDLYIYTRAGRRMFAVVMLGSPVVFLEVNHSTHLMAITCNCEVRVWDLQRENGDGHGELEVGSRVRMVCACSLSSLLIRDPRVMVDEVTVTTEGCPVVRLTNNTTCTYSSSIAAWLRIADNNFRNSSFFSSQNKTVKGPLQRLQEASRGGGRRRGRRREEEGTRGIVASLLETDPRHQAIETTSHLENQMAAAEALHSPIEYRYWLHAYARFLSTEADKPRIQELCSFLMGPIRRGSTSEGNSKEGTIGDIPKYKLGKRCADVVSGDGGGDIIDTDKCKVDDRGGYILGMEKRELLGEILPILSANRELQRTVHQYFEFLQSLERERENSLKEEGDKATLELVAPAPLASDMSNALYGNHELYRENVLSQSHITKGKGDDNGKGGDDTVLE